LGIADSRLAAVRLDQDVNPWGVFDVAKLNYRRALSDP
jgi:hypothetical protein